MRTKFDGRKRRGIVDRTGTLVDVKRRCRRRRARLLLSGSVSRESVPDNPSVRECPGPSVGEVRCRSFVIVGSHPADRRLARYPLAQLIVTPISCATGVQMSAATSGVSMDRTSEYRAPRSLRSRFGASFHHPPTGKIAIAPRAARAAAVPSRTSEWIEPRLRA